MVPPAGAHHFILTDIVYNEVSMVFLMVASIVDRFQVEAKRIRVQSGRINSEDENFSGAIETIAASTARNDSHMPARVWIYIRVCESADVRLQRSVIRMGFCRAW